MTSAPQAARPDIVRISKLIRAPMTKVFAWCTDYSDLDPHIIGSGESMTRSVVARDSRSVVFVDTYLDPTIKARKVEVSLLPPNGWRAKFSGGRWEGTGTYTLAETRKGTRLDIVFRMERAIEGYTAEDLRRRVNEVWDKYVAEMEKALRSVQ